MLSLYKYNIPFKNVFRTALGSFSNREGLIISYEEDGIIAFGEVSPLPGFSSENVDQVTTVLQKNSKVLERSFKCGDEYQVLNILDSIHAFPSLSFGLDTLRHDLYAKKKKQSLNNFLFKDYISSIACNTTIGISSELRTIQRIKEKVTEGFNTFKVKVGLNFDVESKLLSVIRSEYPGINIRIDANQAWTKEEALKNLDTIADLEIEYCEQPVAKTDFQALKFITDRSPIKIAADESVGNKVQTKELIEANCCDIIIIKPAQFGLFDSINVTKSLATSHNMEVVFTTLLDGIIGRTVTAHLASGFGSKVYAHGLDTGSFLLEKGSNSETIKNGSYLLSNTYGIGNPINTKLLQRID